MNINAVSKTCKNLTNEQKLRSHGIIRVLRQNKPDEFILAEEKLKNPMQYYDTFIRRKNEHPTNLTNELQRIKYEVSEVKKLLLNNPNLNRTVGSLPQKWGRKIGNNIILREGVENTFSEFAQKFHNGGITQRDIDLMQIKLSLILDTEVKVSHLGQGYYGKTYKINADSQDYVLKVFYQNNIYGENLSHGNYAELASAVYAGKHETDKFATFYMGKFGQNNDGYILTKYIPEKEAKIRYINGKDENAGSNFVFSKLLRTVEARDDAKGNKLGKRTVDYGNVIANKSINLDPKTYSFAKTIGKCLDMNNSKELDNIIKKYGDKKEFKQAVGYMQELINTKCTIENYRVLENKKELLDKLNLDYVPDIRYALSKDITYITEENQLLNIMYKIPFEGLLNLWEKYHKILQNIQKH